METQYVVVVVIKKLKVNSLQKWAIIKGIGAHDGLRSFPVRCTLFLSVASLTWHVHQNLHVNGSIQHCGKNKMKDFLSLIYR